MAPRDIHTTGFSWSKPALEEVMLQVLTLPDVIQEPYFEESFQTNRQRITVQLVSRTGFTYYNPRLSFAIPSFWESSPPHVSIQSLLRNLCFYDPISDAMLHGLVGDISPSFQGLAGAEVHLHPGRDGHHTCSTIGGIMVRAMALVTPKCCPRRTPRFFLAWRRFGCSLRLYSNARTPLSGYLPRNLPMVPSSASLWSSSATQL